MAEARRKIDTAWFRDRLNERRMSQRQFARHLGLDPSAVSLMLRGQRSMRLAELEQVARLLGVSVGEVLEHAGVHAEDSSARQIPVVGHVDGEGAVVLDQADSEAHGHVEAPPDVPEHAVGVIAQTEGSPLRHLEGSVFLFSRHEPGQVGDIAHRLSIVHVADDPRPVIAYVRRGLRRGLWTLDPLAGGAARENVRLDWGTPILWARH